MSTSKTIAVVGDSKGIGESLREQLLSQGHKVIGVSRSGVQRGPDASGDYQSLVFDAAAHPCDLSGFTEHLDGLVYCPGTIRLKPLKGLKKEHALEDWTITLGELHRHCKPIIRCCKNQIRRRWCYSAQWLYKRECRSTQASPWRKVLWKVSRAPWQRNGLPRFGSTPSHHPLQTLRSRVVSLAMMPKKQFHLSLIH